MNTCDIIWLCIIGAFVCGVLGTVPKLNPILET